MLPFTKMSFFTDKKEVQRSAAALGYVGHVCSMFASHFVSRSFVFDDNDLKWRLHADNCFWRE